MTASTATVSKPVAPGEQHQLAAAIPSDRLSPRRPLRPHAPWTPYAFLLPAMLILGIFVIWAFVQVIYLSFTRVELFSEGRMLGNTEWVGLDNYRRVLGGGRFWWCLFNSFIYLLVTPAIMLVSLGAAIIVQSGLRGLGAGTRALIFLPVVTPTIVAAIAWRVLFTEDGGIVNAGLDRVGFAPVPWLSQWPWVLVTAMVVTLWKGFGYYMMIFVAGLMAVPRELEEAATIDGAGRWGVFRNVTLPSLRPVLVLVAIISSISALKVFDEIWVLARGTATENKTAVPLLFDTAFEEGSFGAACAIGVCLFVVLLAFSAVNLKLAGEK